MPNLLIGPPNVLDRLVADGYLVQHQPLARSCGGVLLVKKENPNNIRGFADLARDDTRLFISNPAAETISYETYAATVLQLAAKYSLNLDLLVRPDHSRIAHGVIMRHSEALQALLDDRAECVIVFHHLTLRYARAIPGLFETVQISAQGDPDNLVSDIH
jgi:ABC-type amino acid transport substrate-binding protein